MKRQLNALLALSLLATFLLLITGCQKDLKDNSLQKLDGKLAAVAVSTNLTTSLADLIAYKKSPHEIMMGYFRTWRDKAAGDPRNTATFKDIPDSVDIAVVFGGLNPGTPFADSLRLSYIPYLHARGTKVIITGGITLPAGYTHDATGYAAYAKFIMDSTINYLGLDGYDVDVESNPSGSTLTDMVGIYKALSGYMGPHSGTGKLLTYDTNQDGSTNNFFTQVYTLVDYVFLQAYGRGASTLQGTFNTYSSYISAGKFIPGFSFYEENGQAAGNIWYDVTYPRDGTGRAYDYARWEPSGSVKKGGIFAYAIDRDVPVFTDNIIAPDFGVTRQLISIMNPVAVSGGIAAGGIYSIAPRVAAGSRLDVSGSGTANGTKVQIWTSNGTNAQKWKLVAASSGYFYLQPQCATASVLDVYGAQTADGTKVELWQSAGGANQQWKITDLGNGYFKLTPKHAPGSALDVSNGGTADGTQVQIWTDNGTNAQQWQFTRLQ
ncbi:ricin-type beta-trefoil lectin protein [Chitinophaga niastensis]|uniref:mannosyl-glycoprotein endo-beta-N-acetylglucosaminidase n=1 Tax=Chitinophaga niastensis TaxID=536980 RepID=A0A2P8HKE7_CHINA|nr:RICIN domain-containing protein [Chitinophaga niastensis]PSL46695.1 ricin-type beta-trefoil lectin protein [Chitinophaga niastensis]